MGIYYKRIDVKLILITKQKTNNYGIIQNMIDEKEWKDEE